MIGEKRTYKDWPRLTRLDDDRTRVRGRVLMVGRYLVMFRVLRVVFVVLAWTLLASATQGIWYTSVPEGTEWFARSNDLLGIRFWLRDLAAAHPEAASLIAYDPHRRIDWHLGVISLCLFRLGRTLAAAMAALLTPRTSFVCTISDDAVELRVGALTRLRLSRRDPAHPISIRAVGPEAWNAQPRASRLAQAGVAGEGSQPPGIVEVVQGFRRQRVMFVVRVDRAEAIAARCAEALRGSVNFIRR